MDMPDIELDNPEIQAVKLQAFRTIYRAIYEGQDNSEMYKENFLLGHEGLQPREYIDAIEQHCRQLQSHKEKRYSKVLQAWRLAEKHYENCSEENMHLFNAIYVHAVQNTWYLDSRFFTGSPKVEILTLEEVKEKQLSDKVIWQISYQLANPTALGDAFPTPREELYQLMRN